MLKGPKRLYQGVSLTVKNCLVVNSRLTTKSTLEKVIWLEKLKVYKRHIRLLTNKVLPLKAHSKCIHLSFS